MSQPSPSHIRATAVRVATLRRLALSVLFTTTTSATALPRLTATRPLVPSPREPSIKGNTPMLDTELSLTHTSRITTTTICRRSLGQGNIFTGVYQSFCRGEGRGVVSHWVQVMCTPLLDAPPWIHTHPLRSTSGRYASYWNAFLLLFLIQCNLRDSATVPLLTSRSWSKSSSMSLCDSFGRSLKLEDCLHITLACLCQRQCPEVLTLQ